MRFLLLFSFLAVVGCAPLVNPGAMPSGYTYHYDEYKSPPGPDAKDIGYEYSYAKNEVVQHEWIQISRDLVEHLEEQTGLSPRAIHVSDVLRVSAFNQTFDYALRYVLREKGYTLVSGADAYPARLVYEAIPVDDTMVMRVPLVQKYKEVAPYNLILRLYTGSPEPVSVGKIYDVPGYGYSKDGFVEVKPPEVDSSRTNNFHILGGENN